VGSGTCSWSGVEAAGIGLLLRPSVERRWVILDEHEGGVFAKSLSRD
jgi:hypothetical protein